MTFVLDGNMHSLAVDSTFDGCQDFVKALFSDEDIKKTHQMAAIISINWALFFAHITYYFKCYGALRKKW